MKVMHILFTGYYSGAENVVISLMESTSEFAESIYVSPDGPIRKILNDYQIPFFPMNRANLSELKRAISAIQPDIIHTHDFLMGTMAVLSKTKIPIINHLHNNAPWIKRISPLTILYYHCAKKMKCILTVSGVIKNEFCFGDKLESKWIEVGNPIDIKKIQKKADEITFPGEFDVVFLGRMTDAKNPLLFLQIVSDLTKKKKDIKVAMIGSGELLIKVKEEIELKGLTKVITLFGFQENPLIILKKSKIMCMPSKWEGFGMAAVEGLAMGLPVVSSYAGGLDSIINDECGKKCNAIIEYVEEILTLLMDERYYQAKKNNAKNRALELDNIKSYSQKIVDIYSQTLDNN